jgi:UDPglucose--hexose-1-phosphate uridylyltransferase
VVYISMSKQKVFSTRRYNPLTKSYILVSPLRISRPWSQSLEEVQEETFPSYDSNCYLCPGNTRNTGDTNPNYTQPFMFKNDFPSLSEVDKSESEDILSNSPFFKETIERGTCEVICYGPKHNSHFMHQSLSEIEAVITLWQERFTRISEDSTIKHIQLFETRGKEVGNSSPHPHCQIWAQTSIPSIPQTILDSQAKYFQEHDKSLLVEYVQQELEKSERVIATSGDFVLLVPYWAEWPYEMYITATKPISGLHMLTKTQKNDLAQILKTTSQMYASIFKRPINGSPYMMLVSQQPTVSDTLPGIQLFFRFICPLLTPTRQKFQAGYEKSAEPQRDITPEDAAKQLREVYNSL